MNAEKYDKMKKLYNYGNVKTCHDCIHKSDAFGGLETHCELHDIFVGSKTICISFKESDSK